MSKWFDWPRLRQESARATVLKLGAAVKEFWDSKPYEVVYELDPDGVHETHKIRMTKPIPPEFALHCAHIAEDLRAALDTAITACALANKDTSPAIRGYPICDSAEHFENRAKGACKGVPPEILDLVRQTKPYVGGNPVLVALRMLSNGSKHVTMSPVQSRVGKMDFKNLSGSGLLEIPGHVGWNREKGELTVARYKKAKTPRYQARLEMRIAFEGKKPLAGMEIVQAMADIHDDVLDYLTRFEQEIDRLFPDCQHAADADAGWDPHAEGN